MAAASATPSPVRLFRDGQQLPVSFAHHTLAEDIFSDDDVQAHLHSTLKRRVSSSSSSELATKYKRGTAVPGGDYDLMEFSAHAAPGGAGAVGGATGAGGAASMEDLLKEIKESREEIKAVKKSIEEKKRPSLMLSDIDSDGWHMMLAEGGFTLDATTEWPAELTARLIAGQPVDALQIPPAFAWAGSNEPDQKDRYLPHLRTHLQLHRYREAEVVSLDDKKSFLSVSDKRLLFDIRGTTDVAVVHKGYIAAREESQGVLAVIELKKECSRKATRQTIGQLIAANLISRYSPLAVLTDLREEWHFYWLEGRMVKHLRPPAGEHVRRDAFLFLRLALAPGFLAGAELAAANELVDSMPVTVGKRMFNLSPIKERRDSQEERDLAFASTRSGSELESDEDEDEDDRKQLLFQQVRKMIRHTPWLREICRPAMMTELPLSEDARAMFG